MLILVLVEDLLLLRLLNQKLPSNCMDKAEEFLKESFLKILA
jgi:hypothetical protein